MVLYGGEEKEQGMRRSVWSAMGPSLLLPYSLLASRLRGVASVVWGGSLGIDDKGLAGELSAKVRRTAAGSSVYERGSSVRSGAYHLPFTVSQRPVRGQVRPVRRRTSKADKGAGQGRGKLCKAARVRD